MALVVNRSRADGCMVEQGSQVELTGVDRAILFAAAAHAGQYDSVQKHVPYLVHPMRVLHILATVGQVTDTEMLSSAILHDVCEMTDVPIADIAKTFGENVASIVRELTRTEPTQSECEGLGKKDIRKLRTKLLLADVDKMGESASTIKLADRIVNFEDALKEKSPKALKRYVKETQGILERIPKPINPPLWEELSGLVAMVRF